MAHRLFICRHWPISVNIESRNSVDHDQQGSQAEAKPATRLGCFDWVSVVCFVGHQ